MRRCGLFLMVIVLILVGADEYSHRQWFKLPLRSAPPVRQVQKQLPHLKAPGDASRETKRVVTRSPIRYHGFFDSKNRSVYLADVQRLALRDINYERTKRQLPRLRIDRRLNRIAKLRAVQANRDFNHYNRNGQVMACLDAVDLHIMPNYQQARSRLSECLSEQAGNIGNTAGQVSQTAIHGMIYDDARSHWGHRKILLDRHNRSIGIIAYLDKSKDNKVVIAYELD